MQGYTNTKPAHAERIVFSGGEEIENTDIMFFDDFIIVSSGKGAPTFYNKRLIDKIVGVDENRPNAKISTW